MFGSLTPMVKNLLLLNVGVYLIGEMLGVNFPQLLGLRYIGSEQFEPYQLFTHIFVHGGGWHLFSNMFALFIFGPMLERFWGSGRFLVFYLVTGLGASILYSAIQFYEIKQVEKAAQEYRADPGFESFASFINEHAQFTRNEWHGFIQEFSRNPDSPQHLKSSVERVNTVYKFFADMPMVGASGAVFGILMAFGYLFPNLTLMLLIPPIPIKAKYLVLFYGLYSLYAGLQKIPGDNVAHFAHLGGMLFAFILLKVWGNKPNNY